MPKSSKKKKEKNQDFTKAKLKLGKGKQVASNAVDTSFKARSIIVPSQSVAKEKDGSQPTTRRKLTLDDLLSHLKHHNANVKEDALAGLEELLQAHPELVDTSLTIIIQATARQIGDEDLSVRRATLSFLRCILNLAPSTSLQPHAHTLLLFTTSALSHIFPEIRVDASKVLQLLLKHFSTAVVEGWESDNVASQRSGSGLRILHALLALLHVSPKENKELGSTSNFALSLASKLTVLNTLAEFINVAFTDQHLPQETEHAVPTWFFEQCFSSQDHFLDFVNNIRPKKMYSVGQSRLWGTESQDLMEVGDYIPGFPLLDGSERPFSVLTGPNLLSQDHGASNSNSNLSSRDKAALDLGSSLQPVLTSIILDYAPAVFSPSMSTPPQSELELVISSLRLAKQLYRKSLRIEQSSPLFQELWVYLTHMAPYFPASFPTLMRRDSKMETIYQEFNVLFTELVAVASFASHEGRARLSVMPSNQKILLREAINYVARVLEGEVPLSDAALRAVLPSVWMLIQDESRRIEAVRILEAMLSHDCRLSAQSSTKSTSIEFCVRMILLENCRGKTRPVIIGEGQDLQDRLSAWVVELPRALWELGTKNLATSELITLALIRMSEQRTRLLDEKTICGLCSRLTPYFITRHPSRGKVPGPFARLARGSDLRRLVVQLVAAVVSLAHEMAPAQELLHAAREVTVGEGEGELLFAGLPGLEHMQQGTKRESGH